MMRTSESVRDAAAKHFAKLVEMAEQYASDVPAARADEELGMRIVDAALALPAGELLKLNDLVVGEPSGESAFAKAMNVLPYLMGSLRLLAMEFAHQTVGVVPYALVSRLFNGEAMVEHEGVELTSKNVFVQYRTLAL